MKLLKFCVKITKNLSKDNLCSTLIVYTKVIKLLVYMILTNITFSVEYSAISIILISRNRVFKQQLNNLLCYLQDKNNMQT